MEEPSVMLDLMEDLWSLWSSLNLNDWLTLIYILLLLIAVLTSNRLFKGFLAAKPEGRKTVLGNSKVVRHFVVIYMCKAFTSTGTNRGKSEGIVWQNLP